MSISGGTTTMSLTLVSGNTAQTSANIHPTGGLLYYRLPTPPGYWLPNSDCVANREPCERWNSACKSASCSTTSGTAPNWTPENCKSPLVVQPCDWQTEACANQDHKTCLLGKKIFFVPYRPVDDPFFPYQCAPGYLGSNETEHQTSSECAGKCPAGFFCPNATTIVAQECPAGAYCPEGSAIPRLCEPGSYSGATRLKSADAGLTTERGCVPVPPGFWAPTGSERPIECPDSGFICPGALDIDGNADIDPPGSQPIQLEVGTIPQTVVQTKTLPSLELRITLEQSLDEFGGAGFKERLARAYGLPPSLIQYDLSAGSLVVIVHLASRSEAERATLRDRVVQVNDAALTVALGGVTSTRGPTVTNGTMDITSSVTRPASCPLGHWCTAGTVVACTKGTYNNETNQYLATSCRACPESATSADASTSIADCYCEAGYYNNATAGPVSCAPCFVGTTCTRGYGQVQQNKKAGINTTTLPIAPGYFRLSSSSLDVRRCPDASVNCSDAPACAHTTSACRGTLASVGGTTSDLGCHTNLTGAFCQLCEPHSDGTRVHYEPATNGAVASCRACGNAVREALLTFFGIVVAVALALLLLRHTFYHWLSAHRQQLLRDAWRHFTPHVKLKIL